MVLACSSAAPRIRGAGGGGDSEVRSWRVGSFTVFAETEPLRIAIHVDGRPILAERARRDGSAFELRTTSGWHSLARLRSARRDATVGSARERPLVLEGETAAGSSVRLRARPLLEDGALELRWELPGQEVLAVRDDFVRGDAERFHGVADAAPWLLSGGDPATQTTGGSEPWLLSSRGLALRARSTRGAPARAFFPDPDSLRIQALGSSLELTLLAGSPRETLPRISSLSSQDGIPRDGEPDSAPPRDRAGFWLRLDRLPDRSRCEHLLGEFAARGLPVPALVVQEDDGKASLLEIDPASGGLPGSPRPVPLRALPRRLASGASPWGELADAIGRRVDRSLTGSPEWISVPLRVLQRASVMDSPEESPRAPAEGPVPRSLDSEFAARALVVAAMQPLLCVDREDGDSWFEIGDEAVATARRYLQLQAALARLGRALAADETERRLPLWRHVFVEFPDDPVAWEARDQWLFGPDVLIAPVLSAGVARRVAYFPAGVWLDVGRVEGRRVVRGPKRALIDVPPGEIGLFERRGARWGVRRFLSESSAADSSEE